MKRYKDIIFDLGCVILEICRKGTFEYWAKRSGVDADELMGRYKNREFYYKFEKGLIDEKVFREKTLEILEIDLSREDFIEGWNRWIVGYIPGVMDMVAEIPREYRRVVLSNTNEIHAGYCRRKFPEIFKHFDVIFFSHEIGLRKPEPEIYEHVINNLNAEPDKILYFDDHIEYLEPAGRLGIKGVCVNSPEDIIEGLEEADILPKKCN